MIPRLPGLSTKVDTRNLVGGLLGLLVTVVVVFYIMSAFNLGGDSAFARLFQAFLLAASCALLGAVLGALPSWLWKPAIVISAVLFSMLYGLLFVAHESEGNRYVVAVQLLVTFPPLLAGTLMMARFRSAAR